MEVLDPLDTNTFKPKVKTKAIIEEFLSKGLDSAKVDVESTNRPPDSLYRSILVYLQRHDKIGVEVRMENGRIILYRVEQ